MTQNTLSRRHFLKSVGMASAALALVACESVSPAPTGDGGSTASGDPTELSLWGWWDIRMAFYESVANAFTEENSDVSITVETLPGGEIQQKLYAALAAETGPNMLKMGENFFQLKAEGLLLPFPEDVFPNDWFTETYPSVNWEPYGRHVVPTAACGTLLVYNKRLFEEAGLDPDTPPATWDEFIEAAKATTKTDAAGISQAGFIPAGEWLGLSQIYQLGGNIVTGEGDSKRANFDSEEVVLAFKHLSDLANVHNVWDPTFPGNLESVGSGLAAMTEDQAWVIGEFAGSYADIYPELGFAPNPTPSGKPDPYYGYKSTVLSVSALDGHPDQAGETFRCLEYLYKDAGKDAYWGLAELISCAPVRADLADDPRLRENEAISIVSDLIPFQRDPVAPPEGMYGPWSDALSLMTSEGIPVETALAGLNEQIQALIDEGVAQHLQ
ncbi:substrate-binding domain-containing protein [Chloroflexi bacterium TSY]|nr:substrate-binding domain-containing protein [Chloroflexi bacterium TSY]